MRTLILIAFLLLAGCGSTPGTGGLLGPGAPSETRAREVVAADVGNTTVNLHAGWNAVGFQCAQLTSLTPNPNVAGLAWFNGATYEVEPFSLADANAGAGGRRGLWLFANNATSITYAGQDVGAPSLSLHTGWNLVSFAQPSSINGTELRATVGGQPVPVNSVLLNSALRINPDNSYTTVQLGTGALQGGYAYWMYATSPVSLAWGPLPAATSLRFVSVPGVVSSDSTVNSGLAFNVTAEVLDQYGQRVTTSGSVIELVVDNGPAGTVLGGDGTEALNAGLVSFSGLSLNRAGTVQLRAQSPGLTSSAPSAGIQVQVGNATRLGFADQPNPGTAGQDLSVMSVEILDAAGNRITSAANASVSLSIASGPSGGAVLYPPEALTQTTSAGAASFSGVRVNRAGTYTLQAAAGGYAPATSNSFAVSQAVAHHLEFSTNPPATVTAGGPAANGVSAWVYDQDNQRAFDYSLNVTLEMVPGPTGFVAAAGAAEAAPQLGATTPELQVAAVNGSVNFPAALLQPNLMGSYKVRASGQGVSNRSTTEPTFTVTAGPPATVRFAGSEPVSGPLGPAVPSFDMIVRDAKGNERNSGTITLAGPAAMTGNTSTVNPGTRRATFNSLSLAAPAADSASQTVALTATAGTPGYVFNFTFARQDEYRASTTTDSHQFFESAYPGKGIGRSAATGDYVIAWFSNANGDYDVHAQRFNTLGVPQGGEFRVNTTLTGNQEYPSVGIGAAGDFVIAWQSNHVSPPQIFAQRYSAAGAALGGEFQVSSVTQEAQYPTVACSDAGSFVVAWTNYQGRDGSLGGVYGRRFAADGTAQGGDFLVNQGNTSGRQENPQVAMHADGRFAITYTDYDVTRVKLALFAANGTASPLVEVDTVNGGYGAEPAFSPTSLVVAYGRAATAVILYRRFDLNGTPTGSPVTVSTGGEAYFPSVNVDALGRVAVAWFDTSTRDGTGMGVYARYFDPADVPPAADFSVSTFAGDQVYPALAGDRAGNFVVAWSTWLQDGSGLGTYARRYGPSGTASQAPMLVPYLESIPPAGQVGQALQFQGLNSSSRDPFRTIVSYEYDFNNDGVYDATGPTVNRAFASAGQKTVILRVTDDLGRTATTSLTLTINP